MSRLDTIRRDTTHRSDLHPDGVLHDSVVIGAGQAGLSAAHHLERRGIEHLVLDANAAPGGAWQHRWDELTMADVHGVADLPGVRRPDSPADLPANRAVPAYFDDYERHLARSVLRPAVVRRIDPTDEGFAVRVVLGRGGGTPRPARRETVVRARTVINATGTWTRPFVPHLPGQRDFAGRQLHTVDYPGADWFVGRRTVVVGGGASAVQFLGALAPVVGPDDLVWVTRTPPDWRSDEFTPEVGAEVVAQVQERAAAGLAPRSVVSVTGLRLREQEQEAERLGVYAGRRPMFSRIVSDGVRWDRPEAGGRAFEPADTILWATGFRPAIEHLAPLRLRSRHGGIQLADDGTTAVRDARVQLVGYGPSASTIGANRAGRRAALGVRRALAGEVERSAG